MSFLSRTLSCVAAIALASSVATAAPLFSSSLDDLTGLSVSGQADTAHTPGYDYSADGIPEAPNNVGGAPTTGLKMAANISSGSSNEIYAHTTGLNLSGKYSVQVDLWINANGPFPGGGGGSTEFGGFSVGTDGTSPTLNGGSLIYTGEGGSGTDYRVNSGTTVVEGANAPDEPYVSAFPGVEAPASQMQTGSTQNGAGGLQWMTLLATVDTDAQTAEFQLTSATSGNTVVAGTITGESFVGEAGLYYADFFSSVSDNAALSFGVFDNMVVTAIPEPSSIVLLSIAGLALLRCRR